VHGGVIKQSGIDRERKTHLKGARRPSETSSA
ncbi:MAG: hypothetical protein ACI8T1_002398, partial [Verrucomicrobiales bacterium]